MIIAKTRDNHKHGGFGTLSFTVPLKTLGTGGSRGLGELEWFRLEIRGSFTVELVGGWFRCGGTRWL